MSCLLAQQMSCLLTQQMLQTKDGATDVLTTGTTLVWECTYVGSNMVFGRNLDHMAPFSILAAGF